uniref:Uncharacterized protein n=1 Tax=viral metagenome TaxID=1070528 RepID=A0A6H1ZA26_9ZZZZ
MDAKKYAEAAKSGTDPSESYDSEHGTYVDASKTASEDEKWGLAANPVTVEPSSAKNLRSVG